MGIHRRRVDLRHDKCCGLGTVGTDSTKYVGRLVSGVARRAWAGATIGPDTISPDPGQGALLADPGFILEPNFDPIMGGLPRTASGNASPTFAAKFF